MQKVLTFLKEKIEYIENQNITFWNILFSVYLASFLRAFFEGYTNLLNNGKASSFIDTFFHYPFWFFGVFSGTCIILTLITKEDIRKVSKLFIYSPFLVITPVIFDFFLNGGNKVSYNFITGGLIDILKSFLSFISYGEITASIGMRIEILIGLIILSLYIYLKTKSFKKIIIGLFSVYTITFLFLILPTIFFGLYNIINPLNNTESISTFFKENVVNSSFNNKTFIFGLNKENVEQQLVENQYSRILSLIILFIDILLLSWCFWIYSRKKFIEVVKNFRFLRIFSYFSVLSFGILLGGNFFLNSFFDIFYIISIFLIVLFIWLFCVWENDEVDLEIDKISNFERPLPQGKLSMQEWSIVKYIFLSIGICFAFLNGFYSFFLAILFVFIYHIYSVPPFRFKKIIGLSSFLVSFNVLIIAWLGYFSTSGVENLNSFPLKYSLFILIFVFLIENIKNIKDIKGDRLNKIKTIPNIIGEKKSKLIFGLVLSVFCLTTPFVFYLTIKTLILSIVFAIIMFLVMNKKKFEEKYVFITYFSFVLFFILSILF